MGGVPLKRTWGHSSAFPVYPAGSECGGALWVVVPLCIKNLWKEAVVHFKYRQEPAPVPQATQVTPGADMTKIKVS